MKNVNVERFEKGPKADAIHFEGTPIQEPPVMESELTPPSDERDKPARGRANSNTRRNTPKQELEEPSNETVIVETDGVKIVEVQEVEDELILTLRKAIKEGTVNNQGIRFSQKEADDLRDVGYEIATKYRFKLPKNDMIRLGLDYLIADYRKCSEESVLVKFVVSKRDLV